MEREHDNLRAVQSWSTERAEDGQRRDIAWRLAGALQWFWVNYGYVQEGRQFVERALARDEGVTASVRANALHSAGWLAAVQGEYDRAEVLCEESLKRYQGLQDPRGMAMVLDRLGWIASSRGDYRAATSLFEKSLARAREAGLRPGAGYGASDDTGASALSPGTHPVLRSPTRKVRHESHRGSVKGSSLNGSR